MWLKYLLITLLFFILVLLQAIFLPFFSIIGIVPNLVFILFFILTFFACLRDQKRQNKYQIEVFFMAIIAGLFLDIFSSSYFGPSIISLLIIYFSIKAVIHFLKDRQDKYLIFYFLYLFLFSFFIYNLFLGLLSNSLYLELNFKTTLIGLLYNLVLVYIGFYIYLISNPKHQ